MSPTIMVGASVVLTVVMNLLRCGCYLAVILACIQDRRSKGTKKPRRSCATRTGTPGL